MLVIIIILKDTVTSQVLLLYSCLGTSLLWRSTVAFTCLKVKSSKCLCLLLVVFVLVFRIFGLVHINVSFIFAQQCFFREYDKTVLKYSLPLISESAYYYIQGRRSWGVGVLLPRKYEGWVRVCFDALKCRILSLTAKPKAVLCFTQNRFLALVSAKSQTIGIKFCTHLLLYGIHL